MPLLLLLRNNILRALFVREAWKRRISSQFVTLFTTLQIIERFKLEGIVQCRVMPNIFAAAAEFLQFLQFLQLSQET
jgi:hypothetical protein